MNAQASLTDLAADLPGWATSSSSAATQGLSVSAPQLRARVSRPHQNALVVTVNSEVDAATVGHLREVLWPRLSAAVDTLVIELTEVAFLGVAGLQLLHQAHLSAQAQGRAMALVFDGGEVERAVHMTGLDTALPCFATTEHALRGLGGRS